MDLIYELMGIMVVIVIILACALAVKKIINYLWNYTDKKTAKSTIKAEEKKVENKEFPYKKRYLLTKNEWIFYKSLKPIADKLKLTVLSKIRLADLIEVDSSDEETNNKYFEYIKSKHIDFALAIPDNMKIVLLIELDDLSHTEKKRQRSDYFVNTVCAKCGYKLLRTEDAILLEDKIRNILVNC